MSKIYLFRHAQASYMSANYDKLSPKGEDQSLLLGKWIKSQNISFHKVYRGSLFRHQQTYEIASKECRLNDCVILDGLKEHQAPAALKMLLPSLIKEDPIIADLSRKIGEQPDKQKHFSLKTFDYFMEGWTSGRFTYEGLQDWVEFKSMVTECFQSILAEIKKDETIAIFTSGGTKTAILNHVLKLTDDATAARMNVAFHNASTTELLYNQEACSLYKFNQVHYLPTEYHTFV